MIERVYIETTFVSYLTARASRDVVVAGHQQSTKEWWDDCRADYQLCTSELVFQEAAAGDAQAALERLDVLKDMLLLATRQEARDLAKELVQAGALPTKAFEDALHIAVAADQKIPYLLTWNLRHMANATMRRLIESVCAKLRYKAPIICTPEELRRVNP